MTNDLELSLRRMPDTQQTAAVQTTVGRYMQEIQGMVFQCSFIHIIFNQGSHTGCGGKEGFDEIGDRTRFRCRIIIEFCTILTIKKSQDAIATYRQQEGQWDPKYEYG